MATAFRRYVVQPIDAIQEFNTQEKSKGGKLLEARASSISALSPAPIVSRNRLCLRPRQRSGRGQCLHPARPAKAVDATPRMTTSNRAVRRPPLADQSKRTDSSIFGSYEGHGVHRSATNIFGSDHGIVCDAVLAHRQSYRFALAPPPQITDALAYWLFHLTLMSPLCMNRVIAKSRSYEAKI
jgi:hypothetical protein